MAGRPASPRGLLFLTGCGVRSEQCLPSLKLPTKLSLQKREEGFKTPTAGLAIVFSSETPPDEFQILRGLSDNVEERHADRRGSVVEH